MDKYGCSVSGLCMIFNARPEPIHKFFLRLARSKDEMESLVIQGRALAKCPGSIPATKVRTILPLPVILGVIDVLVAVQVHEVVDRYAARILPSTSISPYLECAKRHRQTMDAVHPLSLVIEKGMDDYSRGCICQQDISKYYDCLSALRVARWLRSQTGNWDIAATLLRLHTCPLIMLQVASACACMRLRTIGMHTGSRSAGASGRIPLLDVADQRMQHWQSLGFHGTGISVFVDNLLAASDNAASAIRIQDDCA